MQYVRNNFNTEIRTASFFNRNSDNDPDDEQELMNPNFNWREMYRNTTDNIQWLNPWNRIITFISRNQSNKKKKIIFKDFPMAAAAA